MSGLRIIKTTPRTRVVEEYEANGKKYLGYWCEEHQTTHFLETPDAAEGKYEELKSYRKRKDHPDPVKENPWPANDFDH